MEHFQNVAARGKQSFLKGIRRFPEAIATMTLIVFLLIAENHNIGERDFTMKLIMSLLIMGPCFANVTLITEKYGAEPMRKRIVNGVIFLLGIGFIFLIPENPGIVFGQRYFMTIAVSFLIFVILPYFYRREGFSTYLIYLSVTFVFTYFIAGMTYGGIMGFIMSVESLFEVSIHYDIPFDIALILFGSVSVCFYLGVLPGIDEELSVQDFNGIVSKLISWIGIPLLMAYVGIIYVYLIRIIIMWEWPKGVVGNLVAWYGILAIIIQVGIDVFEENNKIMNFFTSWFPRIFIIPLIMMFVTIGIRIDAYGITVLRYTFVMLALFYFINTLYRIIKPVRTTMVLLLTLILMLLVGTVGPFSALSISKWSQIGRLTEVLETAGVLIDGKIKRPDYIDDELKVTISALVDAVDDLEGFNEVDYLPDDFHRTDMLEVFGFDYKVKSYKSSRFYFYAGEVDELEISVYDRLLFVKNDNSLVEKGYLAYHDMNQQAIIVQNGDEEIYRVSDDILFEPYADQLMKDAYNEQIIVEKASGMHDFKFIINRVSGERLGNGIEYGTIGGYVLIDEK